MVGPEGEGRPTPQQRKPTGQHKPHQEGGKGAPGLPRTVHESAKPPPERPAHEGGQITSGQQPSQGRAEGKQSLQGPTSVEGSEQHQNQQEQRRKEGPDPAGATLFSGVGLFDLLKIKRKEKNPS